MKLPQPSMFKKRFMLISLCLGLLGTTTEGQEYNLTGSSKYAVLGKDFTWTCGMFVPPGEATKGVRFFRNNVLCAIVEHTNGICLYGVQNTRYTYGCSSPFSYILTIPAENMTEYEEGSMWLCQYSFDLGVRFRSLVVTLHLAVDVHNVSLIPSDNPMTLAEGVYYMVRCVVNSNAVPAPTITWYMGSTDITNMAGSNASSIIITVNREHNNRTLECKATNNNKPSKTGATTLNVEYPPSVIPLTQKETKEGQDFLISCRATPGNPITTMFWWIKVNDPVFKQNGSTLQLPYIQRHNSGTYKCIAENTYSNGWKGTDSQEMVVNVLYKPVIRGNIRTFVNETKRVVLTREIDSNPLSNVSWYDGSELLKIQTFTEITNLTIENALCADTKNFTLSVSNAVQKNVTSTVELIVNCT
ncbi:hemicentin-1-like isoform X3 [Crassostrea virginica]